MSTKLEVKLDANDLFDYKVYHNYHNVSGIATLLFGMIMVAICVISIGQVNPAYSAMMGFFGLFFTVYTPIGMKLKSNKQIKTVDVFKNPMLYEISEEKIVVSQGEISEELLWEQIYQIKASKRSLFIYLNTVRASIIPVKGKEEETKIFIDIAKAKLKPFQLKFNENKVMEAARK